MDGREIQPPEGDGVVAEVAEFGGKLLLAVAGGLTILVLVLALVWVAWQSNEGHRKVQHAQARAPGARVRHSLPAPPAPRSAP